MKVELNPADIYTKDVTREILERRLGAAGMCELPEELLKPGVDFVAHIVRNMPEDAEFEPVRQQPQRRTKAKMTGQWWKPTLAKTAVFLGCFCSTKAEGEVALKCSSLLGPGGPSDFGHTWTWSTLLFYMLLAFAGIGMWSVLSWLKNMCCKKRLVAKEVQTRVTRFDSLIAGEVFACAQSNIFHTRRSCQPTATSRRQCLVCKKQSEEVG